ncbi:Lrp/AsnC family transcriptional regulator [Oscillospiraceae bacterium LTW-04]|nr:Lrp/AsnC family transcriptional regulator [Oscillospiraceae bacterium MB24-C1]
MKSILMLLDKNARMSHEDIATATGKTVDEVKAEIKAYEENGTIKGYTTLVDWEKTDRNYVTAQIAVKILLNGKRGFDDIAEQLASFEEVETVTLMSGGYDLSLTVSGKTFQEVAMFVASRLSPLEGVQSTSTTFLLKTYKERGIATKKDKDMREVRV